MYIRVLALFVLAFLVLVTPSWAQSDCSNNTGIPCISNSFSPGLVGPGGDTGIYDFTGSGNGYLVVKFDTILKPFTLNVSLSFPSNPLLLDPTEFPTVPAPGTVCVQYPSQPANTCVQYDLDKPIYAGTPALPVKNVDYKGLIGLTLSYFTADTFTVQTPAFGHAPGDIFPADFTVNILDAYSIDTSCGAFGCENIGPTMHGKIPTPSSLIALNEPSTSSNNACLLSLNTTTTTTPVGSGQKPQIEVTFLEESACGTGPGLRDKTASVSVSTADSSGNVSFPALSNVEGNKFHWDSKAGLNEYDFSLDGLTPPSGKQLYTVTVFSSQVSPVSKTFCVDSSANVTLGLCP